MLSRPHYQNETLQLRFVLIAWENCLQILFSIWGLQRAAPPEKSARIGCWFGMKAFRLGLVLGLAPILGFAASSPGSLADGYARRVWQTQDGLPENTIQAFAQTPDNYLWIGTSGGLVRFDGAGFVLFDHENTPVMQENSVFCLAASRDGSLWAGTDGGGLIRYRGGVFRAYSAGQGLSNLFVRAVYEDRWANSLGGNRRRSLPPGRRTPGPRRWGRRVPALAVHDIREDRAGNLWVAGSTVLKIRGEECREYHLEGSGSASRAKSILETADGTVWVGTVSGLQRLPGPERSASRRVSEIATTVRALLADHAGTLWIGSIGDGLMRYADGRFTRVTGPEGPPSSTVLGLFEDNEQNIWAGMQTGLLRLSRTAMNAFPLPDAANADFGTVYPDPDGSLWVASTHLYHINARRDSADLIPAPAPGIACATCSGTFGRALDRHRRRRHILASQNGQRVQYTKAPDWLTTSSAPCSKPRREHLDRHRRRHHPLARRRAHQLQGTAGPGLFQHSHAAGRQLRRSLDRHGARLSHWRDGAFLRDDVTAGLGSEKTWTIHEDRRRRHVVWYARDRPFPMAGRKTHPFRRVPGIGQRQHLPDSRRRARIFWMSGPNGIAASRGTIWTGGRPSRFRPAVTLYGLSDGVEATQIYGGVPRRVPDPQRRNLVPQQPRAGTHHATRSAAGSPAQSDHRASARGRARGVGFPPAGGPARARANCRSVTPLSACGPKSASGSAICWKASTTNGRTRCAGASPTTPTCLRPVPFPRAGLRDEHAGKCYGG